ncbi:MAG: hypothetical protein ACI93H_001344 [Psychromonas sp.]|jgi:hypothetical protein
MKRIDSPFYTQLLKDTEMNKLENRINPATSPFKYGFPSARRKNDNIHLFAN